METSQTIPYMIHGVCDSSHPVEVFTEIRHLRLQGEFGETRGTRIFVYRLDVPMVCVDSADCGYYARRKKAAEYGLVADSPYHVLTKTVEHGYKGKSEHERLTASLPGLVGIEISENVIFGEFRSLQFFP